MIHSLLKEYLLLEVSALSLKDVLSYVKGGEGSPVVDRLRNLWGKRYRKYSNVMMSLLSRGSQSESSVDLLQKILDALDRYDPYYNTSYLTKEMAKSYNDISLSLEDINNFIKSIKSKSEVLSEDKSSLQDILDEWRSAGSPQTFESNHFDIILADEDITIVKPKTPKGSVAWASCTANGVLEKYGSEDIGNEYKSPWCTSIYKADKKSFNEFYTYYLGEMITLYYVIKNKDYDLNDDYRRICVGIDDIYNQVKFKGSVTVNAKNTSLTSEEDLEAGYSSSVYKKLIEEIVYDTRNPEEKQGDYSVSKDELNILFKNRFKSFTAMSKLRLLLNKTKDDSLIDFAVDLLIKGFSKSNNENDLEFIVDIIKNIFNEAKLGNKIKFSDQLVSALEKLIKMETPASGLISYEILATIESIVDSNDINVFDSSMLNVLEKITQSIGSKDQLNMIKNIIQNLDMDSTTIKLADLRSFSEKFNSKKEEVEYLIDSAKDNNEEAYSYIIKNKLYERRISDLNKEILKNPLLFRSEIGRQLLESLLNKDARTFKYFDKIIDSIVANEALQSYNDIYNLASSLSTDKMFTEEFISTYGSSLRSLLSGEELNRYLTLVYNIHDGKNDFFSNSIVNTITSTFNEEEYKELRS